MQLNKDFSAASQGILLWIPRYLISLKPIPSWKISTALFESYIKNNINYIKSILNNFVGWYWLVQRFLSSNWLEIKINLISWNQLAVIKYESDILINNHSFPIINIENLIFLSNYIYEIRSVGKYRYLL